MLSFVITFISPNFCYLHTASLAMLLLANFCCVVPAFGLMFNLSTVLYTAVRNIQSILCCRTTGRKANDDAAWQLIVPPALQCSVNQSVRNMTCTVTVNKPPYFSSWITRLLWDMHWMWWRRRMEISYIDRVRKKYYISLIKAERNVVHTVKRRKANGIGHNLCRNCLQKLVI
jgi:hypothetical protein